MGDVCGPMQPLCNAAGGALGTAAGGVASGAMHEFEKWIGQGTAASVRALVSVWVAVPSPVIGEKTGAVPYLLEWTRPITYAVLFICIVVAAIRLMISQRGEDLNALLWGLVKYLLIAGLAATLMNVLVVAGDAYANWILTQASSGQVGKTMGERILKLMGWSAATAPTGAGLFTGAFGCFLYIVLMLSNIAQIVLIYVRAVLLVLLVGLSPIAAAAAITQTGREILNRYARWAIAWIIWKPLGATIIAAGFVMIGTGGMTSLIAGIIAMVMAVFALPTLMRLVAPVVAAAGSGPSGAAIAAGVASGAGSAGAAVLGGGGGGGGGSGDGAAMPVRDATSSNSPTGAAQSGSGAAAQTGTQAGSAAGASGAGAGASGAAAAAGPAGAAVLAADAAKKTMTALPSGADKAAKSATGDGHA